MTDGASSVNSFYLTHSGNYCYDEIIDPVSLHSGGRGILY